MEWLRIGEVARRTGLTHRTLRHYDEVGLLVPSGRSYGDYRLYAPADLDRLLAIQHLKSLGMSLEEISQALAGGIDASDALERHIALVEERLTAERELLQRLRRLRDAAGHGWEDILDAIALSERLRHPEAGVRFRAALQGADAVPLADLVDALRDEPEVGVREVVTWAIVQHGAAALPVMATLASDPVASIRRQAAHVLGKLGDPRGVSALVPLLDDPDAGVAAKAAFALGQIGDTAAVAALADHLGSGGATLRATIVTALASLGAGASDAVAARLASPVAATRADAAEVLGAVGDPAVVAALGACLDDPDEDVRIMALMALGEIGGDEAAALLDRAAERSGRTGDLARRLRARA